MSRVAVGTGSPGALVIGIGNPLRGDDGVGAVLVEELAEELGGWSAPGVELRVVQQLTPELALVMVQAERVLFVDAWCGEFGVQARPVEPKIDWLVGLGAERPGPGFGGLGGHAIEPALLAALAHELYGWQGKAALLRVPAHGFDHGAEFSAELRRVLPLARQRLGEWLSSLR